MRAEGVEAFAAGDRDRELAFAGSSGSAWSLVTAGGRHCGTLDLHGSPMWGTRFLVLDVSGNPVRALPGGAGDGCLSRHEGLASLAAAVAANARKLASQVG